MSVRLSNDRLVDCPFAVDIGRPGSVRCAIGRFGGEPHYGTCMHCLAGGEEPPRPRWWKPGTMTKRMLRRLRAAPCSACERRARTMDEAGWTGLPRLIWRNIRG